LASSERLFYQTRTAAEFRRPAIPPANHFHVSQCAAHPRRIRGRTTVRLGSPRLIPEPERRSSYSGFSVLLRTAAEAPPEKRRPVPTCDHGSKYFGVSSPQCSCVLHLVDSRTTSVSAAPASLHWPRRRVVRTLASIHRSRKHFKVYISSRKPGEMRPRVRVDARPASLARRVCSEQRALRLLALCKLPTSQRDCSPGAWFDNGRGRP